MSFQYRNRVRYFGDLSPAKTPEEELPRTAYGVIRPGSTYFCRFWSNDAEHSICGFP